MRPKKPKSDHSIKTLEIQKWDEDTLHQLAGSPEAESLGLFHDGDEVGFVAGDFKTFNKQSFYGPLQENEHWGEGIPYNCSCKKLTSELCLAHGLSSDPNSQTFELRTVVSEGAVELQFAVKGTDRHTIVRIDSDLSAFQRFEVQHRFQELSGPFLAQSAHDLLNVCCGMQSDDPALKAEVLREIMEDFATRLKALLKWDRYKVENEITDGAITRSLHVPIEIGRNPTTFAEKEKEKEDFKKAILAAMSKLAAAGRKITQTDVGDVAYGGKGDSQSLIRNNLKKFDLNWKELKREYASQKW